MTRYTNPKDIRAALNKLGDKVHGMKCRVSIGVVGDITDAIISRDNRRDCWFFCQNSKDNGEDIFGDSHGKEYTWWFGNNDNSNGINWLELNTKFIPKVGQKYWQIVYFDFKYIIHWYKAADSASEKNFNYNCFRTRKEAREALKQVKLILKN